MKDIFKYNRLRAFLAEFYQGKRKRPGFFSYRYFADRAGIKSPVFLKQVIDGERNLTRTMIEKFIHALNLNKKESVFFKNLVLFNQAKEAHEKAGTLQRHAHHDGLRAGNTSLKATSTPILTSGTTA